MNSTTSASCSIEPDSRRSESCGRLSSRLSTWRESCDSARIGMLSSFAKVLRAVARSLQRLDVVDHQQVEPALALEPARARRELRDREAAGLVDIERERL